MSEVVRFRRRIEDVIMRLARYKDPRIRGAADELWELFNNYVFDVERVIYAKYLPSPN
mgnify:CR=1 FL=1